MKIILKKPLWFTVVTRLCFAVIILFIATGCDKSEKPEYLYFKLENDSKYSDMVEVRLYVGVYGIGTYRNVDIVSGKRKNEGFKINLPETLDPNYLHPLVIGDWLQLPEPNLYINPPRYILSPQTNASISNKNVKVTDAFFYGVDKKGYITATDIYPSLEKVINEDIYIKTIAVFTYADSDVSIYGSVTDTSSFFERTITYSIEWKKGWNIWYYSYYQTDRNNTTIINEQWSSTPPNGKMKWYAYSIFLL